MFWTHLAIGIVAVAVPKPLWAQHVDETPGFPFGGNRQALGEDVRRLQRGPLTIKLKVIAFEHRSQTSQINTVRAAYAAHHGGVPGTSGKYGRRVICVRIENDLPPKQLIPQVERKQAHST